LISKFSLYSVFAYAYLTDIAAPSTVIAVVTYYVTDRIFNTDLAFRGFFCTQRWWKI